MPISSFPHFKPHLFHSFVRAHLIRSLTHSPVPQVIPAIGSSLATFIRSTPHLVHTPSLLLVICFHRHPLYSFIHCLYHLFQSSSFPHPYLICPIPHPFHPSSVAFVNCPIFHPSIQSSTLYVVCSLCPLSCMSPMSTIPSIIHSVHHLSSMLPFPYFIHAQCSPFCTSFILYVINSISHSFQCHLFRPSIIHSLSQPPHIPSTPFPICRGLYTPPPIPIGIRSESAEFLGQS